MKRIFSFLVLLSFLLSACGAEAVTPVATAEPTQVIDLGPVIYTDPSQPVEARVEDLLKRMTPMKRSGR